MEHIGIEHHRNTNIIAFFLCIIESEEDEEEVKVESPKMLDIPKSVCGSSKEDILHFLEKAKRKLSNVQAPLPAVQSREIEVISILYSSCVFFILN